ncbi:MAG: RluA family pseudouridine synthase [Oscillospiraceae bacterium]|nr:RluA family pseudouridine synthase [Oscillospiraceae bacterium]
MRRRLEFRPDRDTTVGAYLRYMRFSARMLAAVKKLPDGITADGIPCRCTDKVRKGQCIAVLLPDETNPAHTGGIYVPVLYEDEDYIVYDKPPYMPVHRSAGHHDDTLENISAADHGFHVINRLDRDTTGVCLVAKHRYAVTQAEKIYTAVCCGEIHEPVHIDMPIARAEGSVIKRTVSPGGACAVTDVVPLVSEGGYTLADMMLRTGRTHQIRVHLSAAGYPLAGDTMYGGDSIIPRQALHCRSITFVHQITGETVTVTSALPEDMKSIIKIHNLETICL